MQTLLTASQLFTPVDTMRAPYVLIRDGVIESIESHSPAAAKDCRHIAFADAAILPGFVDIHIHGAAGCDVMEGGQAALNTIGHFLATKGVVAYLATTVTAPLDRLLRSVDALAGLIEKNETTGAKPIGIHLEGPFISHAKCGVHPVADILRPTLPLFERLWQASRGQLKLMTIAPELPNALEVIARATELGVRVSLGHSNAVRSETLPAIAAGASSITHLFNAMRPLDHREPGILGVALDSDLYCEFIADGIHVDPMVARLLAKTKRHDRIVLITDAISATGMPDGQYRLGDLVVDVAHGQCRHHHALAGSVLTLDRAISNFAEFTGLGIRDTIAMATVNPARLLDNPLYGSLEVGRPAHLTVRAKDGRIMQTFIGGQPVLAI